MNKDHKSFISCDRVDSQLIEADFSVHKCIVVVFPNKYTHGTGIAYDSDKTSIMFLNWTKTD